MIINEDEMEMKKGEKKFTKIDRGQFNIYKKYTKQTKKKQKKSSNKLSIDIN